MDPNLDPEVFMNLKAFSTNTSKLKKAALNILVKSIKDK
jgi:hypothetical protein